MIVFCLRLSACLLCPCWCHQAFTAALAALGLPVEDLITNKDLLTSLLSFHILPSPYTSAAATTEGVSVPSLMGQSLTIKLVGM